MAKKSKKRLKKSIVIFLILVIVVGCLGGYLFINKDKLKDKVDSVKDKITDEVPPKKLKIVDPDSNTRPIAVMINNHDAARPYHSGLQDAYLVYEIIVEGGYSRYMAIYKDQNVDRIGSVRSSRHYFLDYALENDAIYAHWGWSEKAENDISSLGINNINGMIYEGTYFYRDNNINAGYEHRGFTSTELLNQGIEKLGYRKTTSKDLLLNYSIDEIDLSTMEGAISANDIDIAYSSLAETSYKYDSENKVYLRYVNGESHTDYVTKKQYTVKNIIVYQVSNHTLSGDVKGRQDIDNIGSGDGYYISNGYAVPIKWSKKSRTSQTVYTYKDGTEIKVNDGNTFIQIQPYNRNFNIK